MSSTIAGGRRRRPPSGLVLLALIPAALFVLPLAYVAIRSWQAGPAGIFAELARARTLELLGNTLILAVSVTTATCLIGVAAAWVVERSDLPMRHWWRIAVSLPLAVPAFVLSYTWSSLDSAFETMGGAIFILTLASYPLVFLPVGAALRGTDPSLEAAARSLGRTGRQTFFAIVLPQARPALGAGALLVLTHMFAEFGALSLLRVQTFTTAIFQSYELQFDSSSAALQAGVLLALCLPPALLEMRLRRGIRIARSAQGSGRRSVQMPLGKAKAPVIAGLGALIFVAAGMPFLTLAFWLIAGHSRGAGRGEIWQALAGSLSLSLPGAIIVVALALPLVLCGVRYGGWFARFADRVPYIVHGMPGVVIAFALVFLSIHFARPFYQTAALVFAAYAMLFMPLAQSALQASVELVPLRLEEMARLLGRGPVAAFVAATLPNILPGIGAALALMVLELMRELTATLILAPTGVATLATEVWSHTNDGEYAAAAPFAALLVLASAGPVYLFTRRSPDVHDPA